MNVYCPFCQKNVEYRIERRDFKEFKEKIIDTYENVGVCNECSWDLYINNLEEENNKRIYRDYDKRLIKHALWEIKLRERRNNPDEMMEDIEDNK